VAEPYRFTPQLALRVAILGGILLVAFAVLFMRLWSLQILSGSQYLQSAQNNQLRAVRLQPPRGPILDSKGRVIVRNTVGSSVQIWPADLPRRRRPAVLRRLNRLLKVPVATMAREIARRERDPLTPVTVKRGVEDDKAFAIMENREAYPGVRVAQTYLRDYPSRALAAQILGHVGEASPEQLARDPALRLGDEAGQGGIEAAYDAFLRGQAGLARLRVDSQGRPRGKLERSEEPLPGLALRLTIDLKLQRAAERALIYGIETAKANKAWAANGGAIVALDPNDGAVLAMASNPTFKPSVYVGRPDATKIAALVDDDQAEKENFRGLNRAIAGQYPAGSTFKPVTALAAMQEGVVEPLSTLPCTPSWVAYKQTFDNWTPNYNTAMDLPRALATSCDTYFYELGKRFYELPPERGHPHQLWARRLGFGKPTGIDIDGEEAGLLPTPEWRQRTFTDELERSWKPGDSIQLAIGQKDLLVTPLQMAVFYALIANGGSLVTPHLVSRAEDRTGERAVVRQRFTPPAPRDTGVDPDAVAVIRQGLYRATHWPEGTSAGVFDAFPIPIAGKTGTAEKPVNGVERDQSWWCGYGPDGDPEIVVCAFIENGGHGGSAAAPAARKVFESFFGVTGAPLAPTESD